MVILDKICRQASLGKTFYLETLGEESPAIPEEIQLDDFEPRYLAFLYLHIFL